MQRCDRVKIRWERVKIKLSRGHILNPSSVNNYVLFSIVANGLKLPSKA